MKDRLNWKKILPANIHWKNKNEAKMCRHLCSITGMNEAELRKIPKFRRLLSNARSEGSIPNIYQPPAVKEIKAEKFRKKLRRLAAHELNIQQTHPDFKFKYQKWFENYKKYHYIPLYWHV